MTSTAHQEPEPRAVNGAEPRAINGSQSRPVDGRTARRDRNRAAVLDAVVDLFAEGDLTPGVHDVAERSGVSLRSVYRYFTDVDDLIAAAIDRQVAAASPYFAIADAATGSTPERIQRFCERRIELFCEVRTVYRAAVIRATDQERVSAGVERCRSQLSEQVAATFQPELDGLRDGDRRVVGGMLDALSQLETIELLFADQGHDRASAVEFLVAAFTRVLCPGPRT